MSRTILVPYEHGFGTLTISVDPQDVPWSRTASGQILLEDDVARRLELRIDVQIEVPHGVTHRVVPSHERDDPPIEVAVAYKSVAGRLRGLVRLAPSEAEGRYVGQVVLPGHSLVTSVGLRPTVLRSAAGDPSVGIAAHIGAILADGPSVSVLFEEPIGPPGAYADIEFEDFETSPDPRRRDNPRALMAIDLTGLVPKIWLNSSIDSLEAIARSRARRGAPRRIRDATFDTIVAQVWTTLIGSTITAVSQLASTTSDSDEVVASLPEWQRRTLGFWAPRMYPELSGPDEPVERLCESASDSNGALELFERTTFAVQAWSKSSDTFDGLMRFVNGEPL